MDMKTIVISVPNYADTFGMVVNDADKAVQTAEEKRKEIAAVAEATKIKIGKYIAELYTPLREYAPMLSGKPIRANSKVGNFDIEVGEMSKPEMLSASMYCYPRFQQDGSVCVTFKSDDPDICRLYADYGNDFDNSNAGFLSVIVDENGNIKYDEESCIKRTLRSMKYIGSFEVACTLVLAKNWSLVKELMNSGIQNWMNSIWGEANGTLTTVTAQMEVLSAFTV